MKISRILTFALCLIAMASCAGKKADKEAVVSWIADGETSNRPVSMFGEVPEDVVEKLGLQDGIPSSMSAVFAKVGQTNILFDAGMGGASSKLIPTLKEMGIDPQEISIVFITHLHGDHIGGLMNPDSFPNAEIWLAKKEYDGWKAMEEGRNRQQLEFFELYKDKLHMFDFDDELPGGVKAMPAFGHTPGHTVFEVGEYLIIGDLMHGAALQLEYPEYCASFDSDKAKSVESRKHFIQYARHNGLTMVGMHIPEPGFIK